MNRSLSRWIGIFVLIWAGASSAERFQSFGDYQIHFNAFPSAFLQPDVAKAAGILRSKVRGVLLVSVLKNGIPVPARVQAQATNLSGQTQAIDVHTVREPGGLYYVGNFRIDNGETLSFSLQVFPEETARPLTIGFQQQVFVD